jgi:NADH-quinone oxidoreductase subunit J
MLSGICKFFATGNRVSTLDLLAATSMGLTTSPPNFVVLIPLITGFLAVLFLLPTPKSRPALLGAAFLIAAVVGFTVYVRGAFGRVIPFTVEAILFGAFSTLAMLFSYLMITQRNPARSAISFSVVILSVCGLFLLLAAPFLMAATIIIYAGAVVVTFLFVLMLAQAEGFSDADDRSREPFLSAAVGFIILATLLVGLQRVYDLTDVETLITKSDRLATASFVDETLKDTKSREEYLNSVEDATQRFGFGIGEDDLMLFRVDSVETGKHAKKIKEAVRVMRDSFLISNQVEYKTVVKSCAVIRDGLTYLKAHREGAVQSSFLIRSALSPNVQVSPHSQSRVIVENSKPGVVTANQLPARNIAALGRSLFTDHLISIEIGGTLLLVATIGTIIIAGGRREKLA